jgi:hypothetical protein
MIIDKALNQGFAPVTYGAGAWSPCGDHAERAPTAPARSGMA